jgi:hypothetical protein
MDALVFLGLHDDVTALPTHELIQARDHTHRLVRVHAARRGPALSYLEAGTVRFETWTASRPLCEGPAALHERVHIPGKHTKILLRP